MQNKEEMKRWQRYMTAFLDLVGKTPLVELKRIEEKEGLQAKLIAKVESFNPAGVSKTVLQKR